MTAVSMPRDASSGVATRLIAFLALYFLLQALLRIFGVSALGVDDAEMVVITQHWAWGYGSQPPLFNWLQMAFFAVLGFGAPAIAILHFLLLFAAYLFVFLSGRLVFASDIKAAGVCLALFAIPQIGWEALHSHTHTLLSLAVASATLYLMLRVLRSGGWADYLLLGVAFALGVLAKYSYMPFAVALLVAALTIPALRSRVLSLRMLAALALALLITLPHLNWVLGHTDETLSRTFKFGIEKDTGLLLAWGKGVIAMVAGVASYVALAFAVFVAVVLFPVRGRDAPARLRPGLLHGRAFVVRAVVVALGLVLLAVLATRSTEVKERWLQPVLFMTPLVLMVLAETRLTVVRERLLVIFSAAIGIVMMVALAITYLVPTVSGSPFRALAPFAELAEDIRALGVEEGTILAQDFYIAGNLRLHLPEAAAAETEYGLASIPKGHRVGPVAVVWSGRRDRPPRGLRTLYEALCGADAPFEPDVQKRLTERYQHGSRVKYTLSVARIDSCPGVAPPATPAATQP